MCEEEDVHGLHDLTDEVHILVTVFLKQLERDRAEDLHPVQLGTQLLHDQLALLLLDLSELIEHF